MPRSTQFCARTLENEILPLLRKQPGFQDELTLVAPGWVETVGISFWDQKKNAETYERGTYSQVLKGLAKVIEGTPKVQTYEVCNSTFHKIAAHVAQAIGHFVGGGGQVHPSLFLRVDVHQRVGAETGCLRLPTRS